MARVAIDPNAAPPKRNERRNEVARFVETHPLARMYRAYHYLVWAREDRDWAMVADHADSLCTAYANLTSEDRERFRDVLPNPPDYLDRHYGDRSSWRWIAYLASLIAVRAMRERLGEEIRRAIVEGRGEDFLPPVWRSLSSLNVEEPAF